MMKLLIVFHSQDTRVSLSATLLLPSLTLSFFFVFLATLRYVGQMLL